MIDTVNKLRRAAEQPGRSVDDVLLLREAAAALALSAAELGGWRAAMLRVLTAALLAHNATDKTDGGKVEGASNG